MSRTAATLLASVLAVPLLSAAEPTEPGENDAVSGREIFVREWVANDPRSHGGDGLGPVFNGSSCVTCHNQGGAGGAGGFDENVQLLSAQFPNFQQVEQLLSPDTNVPVAAPGSESSMKAQVAEARRQLANTVHADFANGDTVVLHRFGHGALHDQWLQRVNSGQFAPTTMPQISSTVEFAPGIVGEVLTEPQIVTEAMGVDADFTFNPVQSFPVGTADNSFPILSELTGQLNTLKSGSRTGLANSFAVNGAVLQTSQRNTTALWGAGLVDRIPDEAIEAIAEKQRAAGGRVSGRVHRLADGRIGRFGWKAQKSSLYDFTMAACAVELGLNIPGEKQATVPYDREYEPTGLDLTKREVDELVKYIGELPQPAELKPEHAEVARHLADGEQLFASVGCAECHVKDVGEVTGLYTDLLLHDLGPDLGSVGSYGVPSVPEQDPDIPVASAEGDDAKPRAIPPTSREWRTPALWGVRDSAPYLHDGRAKTLEQAIAFHGGEAAEARLRFMLLKPAERSKVLAFLKTLVAPDSVASAE